jgi:hypothetical protein
VLDAARPAAGHLGARHPLPWAATGLAGLAIAGLAVIQARAETGAAPRLGLTAIAAARRAIPAGACVLTDQVSFTIAADRFGSAGPGCPLMIDPLGTDYALSPGRDGTQGAGRVPAVAAIMRDAFTHAQYVWLAGGYNRRRIAWTPALRRYFDARFVRVLTDGKGDALYVRRRSGWPPAAAAAAVYDQRGTIRLCRSFDCDMTAAPAARRPCLDPIGERRTEDMGCSRRQMSGRRRPGGPCWRPRWP